MTQQFEVYFVRTALKGADGLPLHDTYYRRLNRARVYWQNGYAGPFNRADANRVARDASGAVVPVTLDLDLDALLASDRAKAKGPVEKPPLRWQELTRFLHALRRPDESGAVAFDWLAEGLAAGATPTREEANAIYWVAVSKGLSPEAFAAAPTAEPEVA